MIRFFGWIAVVCIGLLVLTLLAAFWDWARDVAHNLKLWWRDRR